MNIRKLVRIISTNNVFEMLINIARIKLESGKLNQIILFECILYARNHIIILSELISLTYHWCIDNNTQIFLKTVSYVEIIQSFINSPQFNCEIHFLSFLKFFEMVKDVFTHFSTGVIFIF